MKKETYQCADCGMFTTTTLGVTPDRPCRSCGGEYTWNPYHSTSSKPDDKYHNMFKTIATCLFWIFVAMFAIAVFSQ